MLKEKLLSTLDELERNFQTLSEKGLEWMAKMKSISQNELNQIIKMYDQSRDELSESQKWEELKALAKCRKKS